MRNILTHSTRLVLLFNMLILPAIGITATVTATIANIEYEADNADIPAGATVTGYIGGSGPVTIPDSVDISGNTYNVTVIGDEAFYDNTNSVNLTSVTIGNNVTTIGARAFYVNLLTSVTIGNNVTTIGARAFQFNQLTSVTIPDSVTIIEAATFSNNQLTSIIIPDSVTTIGGSAFQSNQLTSVTIPDSVTTIGGSAFQLNQLTNVTIPDSITIIEDETFSNNQLTSIIIPDSVTIIEELAFNSNQLTSVIIPDSVTTIANGTFQGNQLASITIPNSVTTIEQFAFNSNQLTSVTIPSSVTTIENSAFRTNPNLTEVFFDGDAPSTFVAAGANGSFENAAGKTLYYDCTNTSFTLDTSTTPPTWQGYNAGMFCLATFDSQGGSAVPNEKVIVGNTVTEPTTPTRAGYTFNGWFTDAAGTIRYDFTTVQNDPITLYASWIQGAPNAVTPSAIPSLSAWALALLTGIILLIARAIYRRQS